METIRSHLSPPRRAVFISLHGGGDHPLAIRTFTHTYIQFSIECEKSMALLFQVYLTL